MSQCVWRASRCVWSMSQCVWRASRCVLRASRCVWRMSRCVWRMSHSILVVTVVQILSHSQLCTVYFKLCVVNVNWFDLRDKEIQDLLAEKMAACLVMKTTFQRACSTLQRKLREIQKGCWYHLWLRTQLYADLGDYRGFY